MNKYRVTSILFGIVILFILWISFFYSFSLLWSIIPIGIYLVIIFFGSAFIGFNFYVKSHNKADIIDKRVSITFDDGPDSIITPKVIDLLKKFDVEATFFCIGKNIIGNNDIIENLHDNGHIIGNHSYSHSYTFDIMSSEEMAFEIRNTNQLIYSIINKTPKLFRPPFGVTNPLVKKAIIKTGMVSIGWSLRTFDTVKKEEDIFNKFIKNINPGDVILCHDNSEKTLRCLEKILLYLKENNYSVVSLDKLFNIQAYA